MLQAHALVPEGAGGGSIYKRPKGGILPTDDPSYTLPGLTPQPVPAAHAPAGRADAAAQAAAGGAHPSGSDMHLTGGLGSMPQAGLADPSLPVPLQQAQQQQPARGLAQQRRRSQQPTLQQQQRRHSMQPATGRLAHAAAGPAMRPASAESQVQTAAVGVATQQAAMPGRRTSLPAQIDRQLQFSGSAEVLPPANGHGLQAAHAPAHKQLMPVPEDDTPHNDAAAPPQPAAAVPLPSSSQATAQPAAAPLSARTPGSVAPRELAITALTGLVSTPLRGGFYQFTDERHGFVFQLGPDASEPDSAGALR